MTLGIIETSGVLNYNIPRIYYCLTHWGSMLEPFTDDILCTFFMDKCILIRFYLKYVPKRSIDNRSSLVEVMAWFQIGKLFLDPMTWFNLIDMIYASSVHKYWNNNGVFNMCWFGLCHIMTFLINLQGYMACHNFDKISYTTNNHTYISNCIVV